RDFGHIMREIESFFSVHAEAGTWAGGVHLEITGGDVTECLGGGERLSEDELDEAYETLCDPRLNSRQALDLAFHIAELMRRAPRRHP
ncbi:MAG: 3-deoxy-7-phosphoheptulonate synthase, partial [Gaiellaceae bacterium]